MGSQRSAWHSSRAAASPERYANSSRDSGVSRALRQPECRHSTIGTHRARRKGATATIRHAAQRAHIATGNIEVADIHTAVQQQQQQQQQRQQQQHGSTQADNKDGSSRHESVVGPAEERLLVSVEVHSAAAAWCPGSRHRKSIWPRTVFQAQHCSGPLSDILSGNDYGDLNPGHGALYVVTLVPNATLRHTIGDHGSIPTAKQVQQQHHRDSSTISRCAWRSLRQYPKRSTYCPSCSRKEFSAA